MSSTHGKGQQQQFVRINPITKDFEWAGNRVQIEGVDGVVYDLNNPFPVSLYPNPYSFSTDAAGRTRVSNPYTIFSHKQTYDDPDLAASVENFPLHWDNAQTSGAGTSTTFSINRASTTLAVSATTAGVRVRQTKVRFDYQPGKAEISKITFIMGAGSAGITKLVGAFDGNNGWFLRQSGTALSFVIRSFASGAPVDFPIAQASWNIDVLDGTGSSGETLDVTNIQELFIDFTWLAAGAVAFGFVLNGKPIYCHIQSFANVSTVVSISTPNLPIRYEIQNDGTGPVASLETISCSVIADGGYEASDETFYASIGIDPADVVQANTAGTIYPLCAVRLRSTAGLAATVRLISVTVLSLTNNNLEWTLHLNPTISGALSFSGVSRSAVEFAGNPDLGGGSFTITSPGVVLDGGLVSANVKSGVFPLKKTIRLGSTIAGVSDVIVLAASSSAVSMDAFGGITYREAK